jgi:glycine/serine hydroxymethyltransferase
MGEIAGLIASVLRAPEDGDVAREVRDAANRLCAKYTPYPELVAGR